MYWILLDLLLVLILLLCVILGKKRGAIRATAGLVSCLLALIAAAYLSQPVSEYVFDHYLQEPIREALTAHLDTTSQSSLEDSLDKTLDALPNPVANLFRSRFGSSEEIAASMSDTLHEKRENAVAVLTQQWVRPGILLLLQVLCQVLLFIAIRLLLAIVVFFLDRLFKLPVLKQLNGFLGACFGVVQGIFFVMVAAALLQWLAVSGLCGDVLTPQLIEQTVLLRWILSVSPISAALNAWLLK